MFEKLIHDFIMIWVTIEPISTVALYAGITSNMTSAARKKTALKAVVYSALILVGSIIGGQIILSAMNIKLISLQVAGGIILFLFSIQMIFGQASARSSLPEAGHDIAVFPLAVPSIAGPEAMMVMIVLTDNHLFSIPTQIITTFVMLIILILTYLLMLFSIPILKIIGKTGAAIIERIMGIILAALSVQLVMNAIGVSRWVD